MKSNHPQYLPFQILKIKYYLFVASLLIIFPGGLILLLAQPSWTLFSLVILGWAVGIYRGPHIMYNLKLQIDHIRTQYFGPSST